MKIRKGDHVVVVAGRDKGRSGLVIAAYPDRGKVLVQGVNVVTKNKKVTYQGQRAAKEGGITHEEAPINVSNVQLADRTTAAVRCASATGSIPMATRSASPGRAGRTSDDR
jgi:large subunit ribosomal protein L24